MSARIEVLHKRERACTSVSEGDGGLYVIVDHTEPANEQPGYRLHIGKVGVNRLLPDQGSHDACLLRQWASMTGRGSLAYLHGVL